MPTVWAFTLLMFHELRPAIASTASKIAGSSARPRAGACTEHGYSRAISPVERAMKLMLKPLINTEWFFVKIFIMKCPICSQDMKKTAWTLTNNAKQGDEFKEYDKTTFHCSNDDVWVTTEVPVVK